MNVSVLVCTHGHEWWRRLAETRARPSAGRQGALEVIAVHGDGTLPQARNAAAEMARGDWLCFLDADDELAPGYLDAMGRAGLSCRFCGGSPVGDAATWIDGRPRPPAPCPRCGVAQPALYDPAVEYVHADRVDAPAFPNRGRWPQLNVAVVGALVPRRLFLDVGGFGHGYEPYEDYELWLRCWRAGAHLVEVSGAVYRAFVHEDSAHRSAAGIQPRRRLHERILAEHRAAAGDAQLPPVIGGMVFPGAA